MAAVIGLLLFFATTLGACAETPHTHFDWGINTAMPEPRPTQTARETLPAPRPAPAHRHTVEREPLAEPPRDTQPEMQPDIDEVAVLPKPRPTPRQPGADGMPPPQTASREIDAVMPLLRPDPDAPASVASVEADEAPTPAKPVHAAVATKPAKGSLRFLWPAEGTIVTDFGTDAEGVRNDGINLAVAKGAPIYAAAAGSVAYAGTMKSYGNLVLIRHAGDYVTAYAHAARLTVKTGDTVNAGQIIGYCGKSGDIATPQLHFEIRRKVQPLDPKLYLVAKG